MDLQDLVGLFGKWFGRALLGAGTLAAAFVGVLCYFQENLIYVPRIPGVPDEIDNVLPDQYEMEYQNVELRAEDGTELHGWFMYPMRWRDMGMVAQRLRARPVFLFFQENAGNMAMRLPFLRLLAHVADCSIFAPSYRGYGKSKGSPNEPGLKQDARAALDHLLSRMDINANKIVLFGKSLGGAVAIHLAAERTELIAALIIENTFTSLEELAPKVMPILRPFLGPNKPGSLLLRNKWYSLQEIAKVARKPVLMLTSGLDEMVPPEQMWALRKVLVDADADRLQWVDLPEAHHMDAFEVHSRDYWSALQQFLAQYVDPR